MSRDQVFLYVLAGLFVFMCLFGVGGLILAIVGDPSQTLSLRVVGALGSMFASVIGLVLGYLVGRNGKNGSNAGSTG